MYTLLEINKWPWRSEIQILLLDKAVATSKLQNLLKDSRKTRKPISKSKILWTKQKSLLEEDWLKIVVMEIIFLKAKDLIQNGFQLRLKSKTKMNLVKISANVIKKSLCLLEMYKNKILLRNQTPFFKEKVWQRKSRNKS